MNSRSIKLMFSLVAAVVLSSTCIASGYVLEKFKENGNYKRVSAQANSSEQQEKIKVIEFFLYSCPSCYRLDPKIKRWVEINSDHVDFERVPAVVAPSWVPLAKAFYVADKLGLLEKTHSALFDAIHKDKKIFLNEYSLSEFYEQFGVDKFKFLRLFNSKEVTQKVSDGRILSVNFQLKGVPAVVINNEFKTAPYFNKDQEEMLEVLDFLLDKIKSRVKKSQLKKIQDKK